MLHPAGVQAPGVCRPQLHARVAWLPPQAFAVTDKAIRDELMTILFAGSDTSANTLAFALHALAGSPADLQRAAEEVRGQRGHEADVCVCGRGREEGASTAVWEKIG